MITTIRLVNIVNFFMCVMRAFKVDALSCFQVYNTVLHIVIITTEQFNQNT